MQTGAGQQNAPVRPQEAQAMAKRKKSPPAGQSSSVRENFRREIEHLLDIVPAEQWDDPDIRGVLYDFTPWHRMSSVTLQTRDDDPRDIGAWKYYYSAESGQFVQAEFEAYHNATTDGGLVYHKLLIEAAEALLSIEFGKYNNPRLPVPVRNLRFWTASDDGFSLNKTFLLQVYHGDEVFRFNYCEYVMARRLGLAEPGVAPDRGGS
jgi:hypothetical protein